MTDIENNELIDLCANMIKCRSYSGEEKAMAELCVKYMKDNGFDEAFTDKYGNALGYVKGNRPGKTILFDGHIDTVRADNVEDWHYDPFGATVENGRMYGRGTTDMKGADAAMLAAIVRFVRDKGHDFAGTIWFAGVVHEECFEGVSARIISERVKPDIVVIGEASEMNIKCSQRGRAEICLETYGVPCHSSNPDKGVNAVYAMMKAVEGFKRVKPIEQEGMFGKGIMELTDIISAPYPGASVVPHYCRVTFDRRLLVGETRETVLEPLQKVLDELSAADPSFKAKVSFTEGSEKCYTGEIISADRFFPAWKRDTSEEYIQKVYKAVCDKGFAPKLTGYSFCTNGSHYGGEADIPCIGIGPSRENLAHTVDEYVEIKELLDVCEYYMSVCEALML